MLVIILLSPGWWTAGLAGVVFQGYKLWGITWIVKTRKVSISVILFQTFRSEIKNQIKLIERNFSASSSGSKIFREGVKKIPWNFPFGSTVSPHKLVQESNIPFFPLLLFDPFQSVLAAIFFRDSI